MSGKSDSGKPRRGRIDGVACGTFLAAMRRGVRLQEAAGQAGFSIDAFYRLRRRDPEFAAQWREGMERSAAAHSIVPNNRRRLQLRKMRMVRFTDERRQIFLDHLVGTCDLVAAAEAACVDKSTVYKHLRRDAAFKAEFQAVLEQGYALLEAAALRQRLAAEEALRNGTAGGETVPAGEPAAEFERILKLLTLWDRRGGRVGLRSIAPGRQASVPFDTAVDALARRLKALDIPIKRLPGPGGKEE